MRVAVLLLLIPLIAQAQNVLQQGIDAFRKSDHQRALELLRQAVAEHPDQAEPHAWLGATYASIANDSVFASTMLANAGVSATLSEKERAALTRAVTSVPDAERLAEAELRLALKLDPKNAQALQYLTLLESNGDTSLSPPEKARRMAEALELDDRLTIARAEDSLQRLNQQLERYRAKFATDLKGGSHLDAGEAIQKTWNSVVTRAQGGVLAHEGPIASPMRQTLQAKYMALLNEGMSDFQRALELDPANARAMILMGQLIRDRAPLRDTKEQYDADVAAGTAWMNRGLDARDQPSHLPTAHAQTVQPGGTAQPPRLIKLFTPSYPPAAIQAHVTGSVHFSITIDRTGKASNIVPASGNSILFEAAQDALKQWRWAPGFENGKPVETQTDVEVRFSPVN